MQTTSRQRQWSSSKDVSLSLEEVYTEATHGDVKVGQTGVKLKIFLNILVWSKLKSSIQILPE